MSVVGLTLGSGANATARARPARRASRPSPTPCSTVRRSYHAKPARARAPSSANAASCQVTARPPRRGGEQRGAARRAARRRPAEDARRLGREVPAARQHLGAGPSAIARPSASSTTRSATAAANSGSCVATSTAAPPRRARAAARPASPLAARSMPRVGSSRQMHRGRLVAVQHDRERQPLALAAGEIARVAVDEGRGRRARARRREPRRHALVHAGSRPASGAAARRGPPRARARASARAGRSVAQQRRLAGAVAAHQRDPLPRLDDRSTPRRIARPPRSSCQTPSNASAASRRARVGAARRVGAAGVRAPPLGSARVRAAWRAPP